METAHYHMFWRRHLRDRFSFPEVREAFLSDVRRLAVRIWHIGEKGLLDTPITNEHHMEHLKEDYLSKAANDEVEISWGRYFGRINLAQARVLAMLTRGQHFQLRRVQARALNHHLPNIAVDVSGPMKSTALLKTLDVMGVRYEIAGPTLVERDLVTEVSHPAPDTSSQAHSLSAEAVSNMIPSGVVYSREKRTSGENKMPTTTTKNVPCGYHVIGRDEVKPPSDGPLRRQVDAVPDFRWIDIGAFSIEVRDVKDWALRHPMTPALTEEDQLVLSETIRRARRVLLPVFLDQDGRLLHGAESVLAVAAIQSSEDPVQIETIPAIYLHVEDQAAEAELLLALNVGRAGGSQSELNERRRAAVRTLLLAGHDGTDRLIADLCGLRDSSVVKDIRLRLEAAGEIERREVFVDRRGGTQKRHPDYDPKPAPKERNVEVSGADTSESSSRVPGVETEDPVTDNPPQLHEARTEHRPESTFMGRWHAAFGSAPMWPEQVASLASEMGEEVPKTSGTGDGYRWTVYVKPDKSDRVIVVERTN